MKKASIIMAVLACAMIAAAYTNSVPISTNTRAATEKWTAIRFEPALPPTPANAASKFLNGNREWQTAPAELDPVANAALAAHTNRADNPHGVTAAQIGALTAEADLAALRAYHYGSPDIVESPAEWFVFDGAGTITGFDYQAGRENVVIPWAIGGVPVTGIGWSAFQSSGIVSVIAPQTVTTIGDLAFSDCTSLTSILLPQVQTVGIQAFHFCPSLTSISLPQATSIGDGAFSYCISLASVSLPQAQTIGDGAFTYCYSLASVSLPQVRAVGDYAFASCTSLASVSLPQAQTIGDGAFFDCLMLTSVHMGQNAPAETAYVFNGITPLPTVYVTDPQATGWGAVWNGAPVVRPPLHGSNVTAQAYTLNGDTITEWPSGGGETSIIAPLYESVTNVTVTATQSVYSVAVTGAGPVGIDWSGLSLDGTGRAEITLRLNVADWAGTNVTFAPSLTFDRTPEILVTGVWEFACSTVDGVTTRARQTWPSVNDWVSMQMQNMGGDTNAFVNWYTTPKADTYYFITTVVRNVEDNRDYEIFVPAYCTSAYVPDTFVIKQFGNHSGARVARVSCNVMHRYTSADIYAGGANSHDFPVRKVGSSDKDAHIVLQWRRKTNELEVKAYEAGWRP